MKLLITDNNGNVIETIDCEGMDLHKPMARADLMSDIVGAWLNCEKDDTDDWA